MKYGVLCFSFFLDWCIWTFQPGVDTSSIFGFSVYLLGKAFCYFDDLRVISVLFDLYMCIDFFALAGHFGTSCSLSLILTI